ncbi:hypothetical protein TWF594_002312 [Orbilia oligospora]|nr:hypothetical protein TWF594_002312 [Orbilia oligospora]
MSFDGNLSSVTSKEGEKSLLSGDHIDIYEVDFEEASGVADIIIIAEKLIVKKVAKHINVSWISDYTCRTRTGTCAVHITVIQGERTSHPRIYWSSICQCLAGVVRVDPCIQHQHDAIGWKIPVPTLAKEPVMRYDAIALTSISNTASGFVNSE